MSTVKGCKAENLPEWFITKSQKQIRSKLHCDKKNPKQNREELKASKPTILCSLHKLHCVQHQQKPPYRGLKHNTCRLIFLPCKGRDVAWCCTPTENFSSVSVRSEVDIQKAQKYHIIVMVTYSFKQLRVAFKREAEHNVSNSKQ